MKSQKDDRSNQANSAQKATCLGDFWSGFFDAEGSENKAKGFWHPKMGPDDVSIGAPTMFSQGFDVERDVYTSGHIL